MRGGGDVSFDVSLKYRLWIRKIDGLLPNEFPGLHGAFGLAHDQSLLCRFKDEFELSVAAGERLGQEVL